MPGLQREKLLSGYKTKAIGINERYRPMRGYKQVQSTLAVSRQIALAGNHLSRGLRLADLMA